MLDRLLIVGLGSIGTRHVRIARRLMPNVRITALRHRKVQGDHPEGVDGQVYSLHDALRLNPQAAVVATPAPFHLDVALPLAQAGIHLLVEKPLSNRSERVQELLSICQAQKVSLLVGYNLRYMPSLQRFRELLNEGLIGPPLFAQSEVGQFLPLWRGRGDYRETVSAKIVLGGGVLLELSHEIDYLRWLFGEVESVTANLRKQSSLEMDAEDTAHLTMSFAARGNGKPVVAYLTMDCIRQDSTRICTVVGETGTLRWNVLSGTVELFRQGSDAWETVFSHRPQADETYEAEWRHFMSCVADGSQAIVSGHDGLAVLRIVEAARRSSATGMTVPVGSDGRAAPVTA